MPILTVDGNIGCGKSTLLEYLHINHLLPIDLEPVKKWQPYLNDMYYHNKGACEFQVRVWLDRCWIQPKEDTMILMERSPYFQKKVFIPINYEKERLSQREVDMLNEMYDKSNHIWSPSGYIYLRSNPDKCIERIKIRNRQSEEAIDESYIYRLHNLHEYNYYWAVAHGYPMICIDVENKTVSQIANEVVQVLEVMGVVFVNSIYNSFTPNILTTKKQDTKHKINTHGTNNIIQHHTQNHNKSVVSKLRDYSKAAHIRKRLDYSLQNTNIPEYKILKKPLSEGLYSTSNIMTINITSNPVPESMNDYYNDTQLNITPKCTITDIEEHKEITDDKVKQTYNYQPAF